MTDRTAETSIGSGVTGGPGTSGRRGTPAPVWRPSRPSLATLMPYFYVAVLTIAILAVEPALIDGPGAIDVRFSAVFPLAIVAFAQTLNLFTRGIDLSIGGTISVTTAILAVSGGVKGPAAYLELVGMLGLGTVIGAVNGVVIAYSGLQPFLVTLATWTIWDGIALGRAAHRGWHGPRPSHQPDPRFHCRRPEVGPVYGGVVRAVGVAPSHAPRQGPASNGIRC